VKVTSLLAGILVLIFVALLHAGPLHPSGLHGPDRPGGAHRHGPQ
jgi:hypothetical protein